MAEKSPLPNASCGSAAPGSSAALTVVLLYASFASLWILLSDKAVSLIFHDAATITLVSTLKGWLFVGVTSLLLYILVRRLLHRTGALFSPIANLRPLLLPTLLLAVVIVAMTAGSIAYTFKHQQDKEAARLQAIADLKTRQIQDWMAERLGDARFVQTSRHFAEMYARWRDSGDTAAREALLNRLSSFRKVKSFQSVQLLDEQGRSLWSTESVPGVPDTTLKAAAMKAAADYQVIRVGPYRDTTGILHLDFIAPLPIANGKPSPLVVLHTNPADYLFSTLQTWPVPSTSGETLLFRRDGDDVLFLNELRYRSDAALNLRIPISERDLPAAMVLRGEVSLNQPVQGNDYRGVPVIIVARAIEGTDWFLVAKMDRAEIFAQSNRDAAWIALAGLLALFIIAVGGVLFRQRQHLLSSLRDREAQAEQLSALQLLEAIANSSTDAIFAKDRNGRYILFNRAAAATTGTTSEAVLGHDDTVLFPPEQAALVMANDRQVMESASAIAFQENLDTPGGVITFLATKGPLRNDEGAVIGMFGISRDITEREKIDAALRESEQTYRSLFDNMLNGFAYCRMLYEDGKPEDFIYLSVNTAFTTLTGLKEVVGKRVSEVIPGIRKTDPALLAVYGKVASTGVPERVEVYVAALTMWFWISIYSPKKDHFVAIFDVITERKRAEEALQESDARLHLALKSANMGVWEWNLQTDAVIWSPEIYDLFGMTTFGGHLSDFTPMIHSDDVEHVLANAHQAVQEKGLHIVEFRVTRPDGTVLWVTNFARADYDASGKPLRMVGIAQDITRRKQAENERSTLQEQLLQSQKMESVGRLAGGVAHDFNNMLAVIFIAIELIRMKLSPADPLHEHLHEIMNAATRARDITGQLLAFSRKQIIVPQVLDLNESITETEKTLSRLIGEDIALNFIPERHLGKIKIDPSQIDQILMNIAANARDAMPDGGNLTIETANVELDEDYCRIHAGCRPGHYVQLVISDDGIGMSEEVREHVFEPFFTTKEVGKGTGLGLATIYGIVQQNQGFIHVYSEPGLGSTFRLYFPRVEEAVPLPELAKESIMRGEGSILLVEDDEMLCRVTKATLENLGYTVTAAQSPDEALRLAADKNNRFDLLLTDVVMPGMNGRQLCDRIALIRPHLKVLFMSGYTSDAIVKRGVLDDGIQFIQKPFAVNTLAAKLKDLLAQE